MIPRLSVIEAAAAWSNWQRRSCTWTSPCRSSKACCSLIRTDTEIPLHSVGEPGLSENPILLRGSSACWWIDVGLDHNLKLIPLRSTKILKCYWRFWHKGWSCGNQCSDVSWSFATVLTWPKFNFSCVTGQSWACLQSCSRICFPAIRYAIPGWN